MSAAATNIQHTSSQNEMIQIVSIECFGEKPDTKVKPIFYGDRLSKVLERRKDIDKYVFLSIMGPKRKGKSFLINFMICHLRELKQNPTDDSMNWLKKQIKLNEVNWKQSEDSVTKGIWIWNEPFMVQEGEKKYGILLMDCQGLFDPQDSHCKATDTLITTFALKISNIHILNVQGGIESTDLDHLEQSISFARTNGFKINSFDTFIVLIRDWTASPKLGMDEEFFTNQENTNTVPESVKLVKEAFRLQHKFLLPTPGRNILLCSNDENTAVTSELISSDESNEFLKYAVELDLLLFNKIPGDDAFKYLSRTHLLTTLDCLEERFGEGANIPPFASPAEVLAYDAIMECFERIMSAVSTTEADSIVVKKTDKEAIENTINKMKTAAKARFADVQKKIGIESSLLNDKVVVLRKLLDMAYESLQKAKMEEKDKEKYKTFGKAGFAVGAVGVAAGVAGGTVGLSVLGKSADTTLGTGAAKAAMAKIPGAVVVAAEAALKISQLRLS